MSDGSLLSTKGLVGGALGGPPTPPVPAVPTPAAGALGVPIVQGPTTIVIPTAPNLCLIASQNIIDNLRQNQAANLTLPSLYKRAFMVVNQTDEIALARRSGP